MKKKKKSAEKGSTKKKKTSSKKKSSSPSNKKKGKKKSSSSSDEKKTSKKKKSSSSKKKTSSKKNGKKKKGGSDGDYIGFGDPPPKKKKFKDPWYKNIPWLILPRAEVDKELRPVLGLYELYQHFIKFRKDDGKVTGFYINCPDYVREEKRLLTGSKRKCPVCKNFTGRHLPDYLDFYGGYRYLFDAFDLTAIVDDDGDRVFGTVRATPTNRREIVRVEKHNGAEVADPNDGTTIFWEHDPDSDKAASVFIRGKNRKVKWLPKTKKFSIRFKHKGKVYTAKGKPTDFRKIVDVPSPEELDETLTRLGCWDALAEFQKEESNGDGEKKSKKGKKKKGSKKKKKRNQSKWDDDE